MAIEAFERAGRRLREHHRQTGRAVGAWLGGAKLILFETYDDVADVRLRVLYVRPPRLHVWGCQRLAAAVLGHEYGGCVQQYDGEAGEAWFVVPIDQGGQLRLDGQRPGFRLPLWVRWYQARALGQGLGQDDGYLKWNELSMELADA